MIATFYATLMEEAVARGDEATARAARDRLLEVVNSSPDALLARLLMEAVTDKGAGGGVRAALKGLRGASHVGALADDVELLVRYMNTSGGRWGKSATRLLNDAIAKTLEDAGFKVRGGAGRASEEWIPGPGGDTLGGTFVDITASNGKTTVRVQSVTVLAGGVTPSPSELAAAARIRQAFPNDVLILIPKWE